MPDLNKPTGLGYQGTWTRRCTQCGHPDLKHYGKMGCQIAGCRCIGFAARDLSYEEIEIIRNPPTPGTRIAEYVEESIDREIREEVHRQAGAPIPKLPPLSPQQLRQAEEVLK